MNFTYTGSTKERLDRLETGLSKLATQIGQLMTIDAAAQKSLDALGVAEAGTAALEVQDNTLLQGLVAEIAALKVGVTNPEVLAAIDAATAIVVATKAKLAGDITAYTPPA